LLAASSSVLLADFLKTSLECIAVLLAWLSLRRIIHGRNEAFDYGIGKLESLSSVFVGVLMMLGVCVIVVNAVLNIMSPSHISGVGVYISGAAQVVFGVINTRMALGARKLAQQSTSPIIAAQQQLFTSRAVGNVFIFLSLGLSMLLHDQTWSVYIDPMASLIVAGFIGFSAMGVFTDSFNDLLDKTLDEELQMVITRELVTHFRPVRSIARHPLAPLGQPRVHRDFSGMRCRAQSGRRTGVLSTRLRTSLEGKIPNSRVVVGLSRTRVV
jgi:ferrous-iron efflux pump FieF